MIVGMWMTKDVESVGPKTPVPAAAAIMSRRKIRRLPVVEVTETGPRPVGIVSATDIYHAFPSNVNPFSVTASEFLKEDTTVADIMTRKLVIVAPDTPIEEAARLMTQKKIGAVLVVRQDVLVGLITESDIFRAFVSFFDVTAGGARITMESANAGTEFASIAKIAVLANVRVSSLITSVENGRPVCVIRVSGEHTQAFVDSLWNTGHKVLNVVRY